MKISLVSVLLSICFHLSAQLTEGDIMFVGFNADGNDGFSILALVDIPANSTIYFSDNEWNGLAIGGGGAFNSTSEGEITWSTGASIISAGTVVNFLETNNEANVGYGASLGTITGVINLNSINEVLYAFHGTNDSTPTTFLSAISNNGFNGTTGTLTNTGLAVDVNAISITGNDDVMVYVGSTTCNTTVADCAAAIATATNWSTQNGPGDQSADGTTPNFPSDVASSFGGTVLPVELLKFDVELKRENIIVFWETASELNNDFFELYRSYDGMNFISIAKIPGNGSTSNVNSYEYIDKSTALSKYIYYRMRQVDYDGQFEWFETILLQLSDLAKNEPKIYPNPVMDSRVFVDSMLKIESLEVMSVTGKRLMYFSNPTDKSIDINGLDAGNYLVKITTKEGVSVKRIKVIY